MIATWGALTMAACLAGVILTLSRAITFYRSRDTMSVRLSHVFFTDCLIYAITLAFGLSTLLNIDNDYLLYPMRVLFIVLNIVYAYRLTRPLNDG